MRKRKTRKAEDFDLKDWQLRVLETGEYPENEGFAGLNFFYDDRHHDDKLDLYETIRTDFIKDWIDKHPCSRPWAWYRYDAPRQNDADTDCFWHGKLPEPRKQLNGGRRCEYAYVPKYHKAIFEYWHYSENDLPVFESEAAYLQRLNLLTKAEEKYLAEHPELLKPESIVSAIPGIRSQR